MKTIRFLAAVSGAFLVLGFGNQAFAQCAPGGQLIQQNGVGWNAAFCNYPDGSYPNHAPGDIPATSRTNTSVPSKPKVVIVNKYGAVAVNDKRGVIDSTYGQDSQSRANQLALSKCGVGCLVVSTYHNQCTAVAFGQRNNGKSGFRWIESSKSNQIAEQKALAACNAKASNCKIVLSECSKVDDSSSKL